MLAQVVTATDYPYIEELRAGVVSAKRVTDKINEAKRRHESREMVKALENRVVDWRGHNLSHFGELVLDDIFNVTKSDVVREYHVFLFTKIILCCREATGKDLSLLKKQGNWPLTPPDSRASSIRDQRPTTSTRASTTTITVGNPVAARKRTTPLQLKGRVLMNDVTAAVPQLVNGTFMSLTREGCRGLLTCTRAAVAVGVWLLHVQWKGDDDQEHFTLRCVEEEQLRLWESAITRLIKDIAARRTAREQERNVLLRVGKPFEEEVPAEPLAESA